MRHCTVTTFQSPINCNSACGTMYYVSTSSSRDVNYILIENKMIVQFHLLSRNSRCLKHSYSMIRFLLIHFLAFSTAFMPIVCCCTLPTKVGSQSKEGQSKQTAPVENCCCHKQESKTETSAPGQVPSENHRKGCPCNTGKVFLVYSGGAEQGVASRDLNLLDGFRAFALFLCYNNLWDNADLSLLRLSVLRHNDCYLSSVELLRAKCVLRC